MSGRLDVIRSSLTPPDNRIIHYRKTHPLDRNEVRDHIYSEKYRRVVDKCFDVMMENRHIFKHGDIEDFDRKTERAAGAKMVTSYHRLRPINPLEFEKDPNEFYFSAHATYCFDPGMSVRTDITLFLYTKTIINFHRPESKQHKQFIHDGLTAKDIGCFGLTEIGHGSDTKNLQTEAIYDHSSKTFTINTPKDSALKFWIGGLAEIANMALIWAQLIIKGKRHGVHPFVVPIRDRKTLMAFDGVRIGDCGSKIGLQVIDNGYIGFDSYKIPAENIMDRVSGIDENGDFRTVVESLDKRHGVYMSPLSLGRACIAINGTAASNSALLIGIKYACTRRQFESPTNKNEEQLLIDYPLVRFRLMPHLATSFMYTLVGAHILRLYGDNNKELITPKSKVANDLHAISAVAKAKVSWFCTEVIGSIRHLLGGHGYSSYSRLGRLYFDQEINTTWEGDNHMLLQQSFKAVLKSVQRLQAEADPSHLLNFINNDIKLPQSWSKVDFEPLETIEKIFQKRFQETYAQTINYMKELKGENLTQMDIWNQTQAYHGKKLSLLFFDIYCIRFLREKISKMTGSLKEVAENSFRLWTYFMLEKERWNSIEVRTVLQELIKELCDWLAPRSISLIEAIASPEEIIGSPFADWNGDLMWDKYLGLIYSGKDVFSRVPYSQQIVDLRGKK